VGRFLSNPEFFVSSALDEKAAMPVLFEELPKLTDSNFVVAVAGHLRRPCARLRLMRCWTLSNRGHSAMETLAGTSVTPWERQPQRRTSKHCCAQPRHAIWHGASAGRSRAGPLKNAPEVPQTLAYLIGDPDVALHAMQALRRVLGARRALQHLERVEREQRCSTVGEQAARGARKARKSVT
jgi:hypothetical protein